MSSYTIKTGDTLWSIVKNKYGLTNSNEISAKVNEVAKQNSVSNPNSIMAGQNLNLVDNSKGSVFNKPEAAANPTTCKVDDKDNMGTKFDSWTQNVSEKFDKNEKSDDFKFVGDDYAKDVKENGGKNAAEIYKKGLMKLSTDSIKNSDTDGNGTLSYDEFKQKELAEMKKANPDSQLDDETTDKIIKTAFKNLDLNGDGQIDDKENASMFAALDENKNGELNGKISQDDYIGNSALLGDESKGDAMKNKLKTVHKFLFGSK